MGGSSVVPLWFGAWSAAKDWGCPPWIIMHEEPDEWTKIVWVMRNNLINDLMNKRQKQEANKVKRKHGKYS